MNKTKYYNYRSANGRFAVRPKAKTRRIVAGRLYSLFGTTVRAHGTLNGKRLVTAHKVLSGVVPDSALQPITKDVVNSYLARA